MHGRHNASERTPLLRPQSSDPPAESAVYEDDIHDAEVAQGVLTAPQFPALAKQRSYSSSHWLAPDQEISAEQPDEPGVFGEDGLLAGLSRTKFRCIIGGVFAGYFVSLNPHRHTPVNLYCRNYLTRSRLQCSILPSWRQVIP